MALAVPSASLSPTTTIFMDSFQTSLYKLHLSTPSRFLRYYSHVSFEKRCNFVVCGYINQENKCNVLFRNKGANFGLNNARFCSRSSWLDNWNDTHKKNWPKTRQEVLNYRNGESSSCSDYEGGSDGESGGGSGSTMDKIVRRLKKFGYVDDDEEKQEIGDRVIEKGSIEDIFYVEEGMLPNSRGGFSPDSPLGMEHVSGGSRDVRFPWEKLMPSDERGSLVRQKSKTSLAELTLPDSELRRLRNLAMRTKNKTRIGGAGVTQLVVDSIRDKWKSVEVVRLKIEGPPALNMKRMHEILEVSVFHTYLLCCNFFALLIIIRHDLSKLFFTRTM